MGVVTEDHGCTGPRRTALIVVTFSISVPALYGGCGFATKISRVEFAELCSDLVEKTVDLTKKALREASVKIPDVDHVVLVGGTTRLAMVQERLGQLFRGKPLNHQINPDEAVAYGAAIHAAIIRGSAGAFKDVRLVDLTPLSLGIEVQNGNMCVLIRRNTPIPATVTGVFTTIIYDNCTKNTCRDAHNA